MRLPNKLSVAATMLALGSLTGVAMSSGAGKREQGGSPAADIRTVTIQQTIHRYHQIVAGGSANGIGDATLTTAAYRRANGAATTRPSGHPGTSGGTASKSATVKTGPSGKHAAKPRSGTSSGGGGAAPKTRSSGTSPHSTGGKAAPSPTTKPSGSSSSEPTAGTPSAPTTKPSASTTSPTETTPSAPTTKPSGSTTSPTETTPSAPTTKPSGGTGESEKESDDGGGKGGKGDD